MIRSEHQSQPCKTCQDCPQVICGLSNWPIQCCRLCTALGSIDAWFVLQRRSKTSLAQCQLMPWFTYSIPYGTTRQYGVKYNTEWCIFRLTSKLQNAIHGIYNTTLKQYEPLYFLPWPCPSGILHSIVLFGTNRRKRGDRAYQWLCQDGTGPRLKAARLWRLSATRWDVSTYFFGIEAHTLSDTAASLRFSSLEDGYLLGSRRTASRGLMLWACCRVLPCFASNATHWQRASRSTYMIG